MLHQSCRNQPGVAACQAIHAATECLRPSAVPVSDETHACVLVAETSEQLEQLSAALSAAGVHHVLIREPDAPYNGAATAIGCEPAPREAVRHYFAGLKVFR